MASPADLIGVASQVATVLGIGVAIVVFVNEKRKERLQAEFSAYHSLDEKYIEYLTLCLRHPQLDVYFMPLRESRDFTPEQEVQRAALLEILICLLERAFLLYRDQPSEIRRAQWAGWDGYIQDWCTSDIFRRYWPTLGSQFDGRFIDYVDTLMNTTHAGRA